MRAQAAEQVTIEQARAGLDDVTTRTRQEFQNSEARFVQLIESNNVTFAEHKAAFTKASILHFTLKLRRHAGVQGLAACGVDEQIVTLGGTLPICGAVLVGSHGGGGA